MGKEGYITLHRKIDEHWLWQDKPFTKGQAWIDLLLLANYADDEMLTKGTLVKVKRGEVFRTHEYLRERWGWKTTKKVRTFLDLLKKAEMVTLEGTPQGTRITIENYSIYQLKGQPADSVDGNLEGNQKANKGQQKKKKEKEKEEVRIYKPDISDLSPALQKTVNDWIDYKEERKEAYKPKGLEMWISQLRNHTKTYEDKHIIEVIEKSMASQYKGVVWDWLKDKPKRNGKYKEYREEIKPVDRLSAEEQAENMRRMQEALGGMFK